MAAPADGNDTKVQAVGGLSHRAMRALTPALSYGKQVLPVRKSIPAFEVGMTEC
jgi:hypothetical protein